MMLFACACLRHCCFRCCCCCLCCCCVVAASSAFSAAAAAHAATFSFAAACALALSFFVDVFCCRCLLLLFLLLWAPLLSLLRVSPDAHRSGVYCDPGTHFRHGASSLFPCPCPDTLHTWVRENAPVGASFPPRGLTHVHSGCGQYLTGCRGQLKSNYELAFYTVSKRYMRSWRKDLDHGQATYQSNHFGFWVAHTLLGAG